MFDPHGCRHQAVRSTHSGSQLFRHDQQTPQAPDSPTQGLHHPQAPITLILTKAEPNEVLDQLHFEPHHILLTQGIEEVTPCSQSTSAHPILDAMHAGYCWKLLCCFRFQ
jgi:hypothetical protein